MYYEDVATNVNYSVTFIQSTTHAPDTFHQSHAEVFTATVHFPNAEQESVQDIVDERDKRIAKLESQLEIKVLYALFINVSRPTKNASLLICLDLALFLFQNKLLGLVFNTDQIQCLESR